MKTRAEWLAGLQTFDKVWMPGNPGHVVEVVVLGDGTLQGRGEAFATCDLRKFPIEPMPEAPWGRCHTCDKPLDPTYKVAFAAGMCPTHSPVWEARACPGGCKTREEHEAAVLEQRRVCGWAPPDGVETH